MLDKFLASDGFLYLGIATTLWLRWRYVERDTPC